LVVGQPTLLPIAEFGDVGLGVVTVGDEPMTETGGDGTSGATVGETVGVGLSPPLPN
jgi:hypothetical protein